MVYKHAHSNYLNWQKEYENLPRFESQNPIGIIMRNKYSILPLCFNCVKLDKRKKKIWEKNVNVKFAF